MSPIGFMGVGLCGLRSLMCLDFRLVLLGPYKIPFLPLAPTAMCPGRVEEISRLRA